MSREAPHGHETRTRKFTQRGVELLDVWQYPHARMVRRGGGRVHAVRDSVPTCIRSQGRVIQMPAGASRRLCDTSVV
jgi:hypothetical protein